MEKVKWFKKRYLILWLILLNWIGVMIYLIYCGNKIAQRLKDTFPLTPYGN